MARWRVLLPAALVVTLLGPGLRALPWGAWLPDPWLLLLLWAVPEPPPWSWRGPARLVLLLGVLRASVSAASPFSGWAGFATALAIRHLLHRHLIQRHLWSRFAVGAFAALPLAVFDWRAGLALGWAPDPIMLCSRVGWVGILWATALGPGPYPGDPLPADPRLRA